ncbi:MAG: hypothetical protein AAF710_10005 [Planctomycetota bacterium]
MSDAATAILLVHAAATWFMAGLIWFVQVVHYPLFAAVGGSGYVDYQAGHMRRTTFVVLPAMFIELGTAVALVFFDDPPWPAAWGLLGLLLVAAVWAVTFAVSVPAHRRLERGFDPAAHRRLVVTNWIRTALWSARAGLLVAMIAAGLSAGAAS